MIYIKFWIINKKMYSQSNIMDHVKLVTKIISNTVTIQQYNVTIIALNDEGTETFKTRSYGK